MLLYLCWWKPRQLEKSKTICGCSLLVLEAKYHVNATCELMWLKSLVIELGFPYPTPRCLDVTIRLLSLLHQILSFTNELRILKSIAISFMTRLSLERLSCLISSLKISYLCFPSLFLNHIFGIFVASCAYVTSSRSRGSDKAYQFVCLSVYCNISNVVSWLGCFNWL